MDSDAVNGVVRVPNLIGLRPTFLAIHIVGGQVGMPLVVLTFLISKKVLRHPTLINFCITWIIYSTIYCLFLYSGGDMQSTSHRSLCVAQAALIFGAPPMSATAGLVLISHIWLTFQTHWQDFFSKVPRWVQYTIMFAPPYLSFAAYSIASGLIGHKHPDKISHANGLYCTLLVQPFQHYAVPVYVLAILALTLGFEFVIAIQFLLRRKHIKKTFPLADRHINFSLCFRIFLFSLYSWATLVACALFLSDSNSALRHMIPAALPLAALIVFGTQRDLLRVWWFRTENLTGQNASYDDIPTARSHHSVETVDPFR